MAFGFFRKKEEAVLQSSFDVQKRKKKNIEKALVAGTFLLNTGCSVSEFTVGQQMERLSASISANMKYDFIEDKTADDIENIKKTKEFQRINETIQKQGLSIDPSDLAAIFARDKKDGAWKPMIKLSAWRSGVYETGVYDPIKKLEEYGMSVKEYGEAIIAANHLLSKMTGLTVVASLKQKSDTMMAIQTLPSLGEASLGGESTHDDRIGEVIDNQGKYIEIFLKNAFKDIPGGFKSLTPESKRELIKLILVHEELHQLAFPAHIPGSGRSLLNAKFPLMQTEEVVYQGKKQYHIIRSSEIPTLEQDPASIICRGGLFPLFKNDIIKEWIKKIKK